MPACIPEWRVVRSVENGFSMARSARQGNLTLTDGYGRIVAEASSDQAPTPSFSAI